MLDLVGLVGLVGLSPISPIISSPAWAVTAWELKGGEGGSEEEGGSVGGEPLLLVFLTLIHPLVNSLLSCSQSLSQFLSQVYLSIHLSVSLAQECNLQLSSCYECINPNIVSH